MEAGLHGQGGDTVLDLADRDYRPEKGRARTRHPGMAGKNVRDPRNSIKTVYFTGVQ